MSRVYKRVIVYEPEGGGHRLVCAYGDCDQYAYQQYTVRTHNHSRAYPCDHPLVAGEHPLYAFCTERHKQHWLYANNPWFRAPGPPAGGERIDGRLPAGSRGIIG